VTCQQPIKTLLSEFYNIFYLYKDRKMITYTRGIVLKMLFY